jgi:hypothetical protein
MDVAARELLRSYHAQAVDGDEAELDRVLGLEPQAWRSEAEEDTHLARRYPGESTVAVPTPYPLCRGLFQALAPTDEDVFVDLGCGAGRVVLYGAITTPATFRGVELVEERAAMARHAAERLGLERVTIVCGDARDEDLALGTMFYAFRPFSVETDEEVRLVLHAQARRRTITVATYRMPPSLFDDRVFERVASGMLMIYRSRG